LKNGCFCHQIPAVKNNRWTRRQTCSWSNLHITATNKFKSGSKGKVDNRARKAEEDIIVKGNYKIIYSVTNQYIYITDIFDTRQNPEKMRGWILSQKSFFHPAQNQYLCPQYRLYCKM